MAVIPKWKIRSVDAYVEKLEPLCIVDGNIKWHSCCANTLAVPNDLKIEWPYDPASTPLPKFKTCEHVVTQTLVQECSKLHYSQEPKNEKKFF